jgi:methionine-rich copper-binding protein CopC
VGRLGLVVTGLAGLSVALAGPASAHDELVSSSPASGATVAAPTALTLTYSEPLVATGYRVVVRGPGGQVGGNVGLAGTRLVDQFASPLPAGPYDVVWRVVSADGHPISGRLSFTVRGTATPSGSTASAAPTTPATSSTAPSTTSSAAAAPSPTPTSSTSSASSAPAAPASSGGRSRLLTVALIAAVLAAGAALLGARRRGGPPG